MNDNDIIKALECCIKGNHCRSDCPYDSEDDSCVECTSKLAKDALDLINRQQTRIEKLENIEHASEKLIKKQEAEIERLKAEAQMADGYEDALVEMTKSEAIKEFAERLSGILKKKRKNEQSLLAKTRYGECILAVDNLVKEMTE